MDLSYEEVLAKLASYMGEEVIAMSFVGVTPITSLKGVLSCAQDIKEKLQSCATAVLHKQSQQALESLATDEIMLLTVGSGTVCIPKNAFILANYNSEQSAVFIALGNSINIEFRLA